MQQLDGRAVGGDGRSRAARRRPAGGGAGRAAGGIVALGVAAVEHRLRLGAGYAVIVQAVELLEGDDRRHGDGTVGAVGADVIAQVLEGLLQLFHLRALVAGLQLDIGAGRAGGAGGAGRTRRHGRAGEQRGIGALARQPVHLEAVIFLKSGGRGNGAAAVDAVDAAGIVAQLLEALLDGDDIIARIAPAQRARQAGRGGTGRGAGPVCFLIKKLQSFGTCKTIGLQAVIFLKGNHRALRACAEAAVHAVGVVAQLDQGGLQLRHAAAAVAVLEGVGIGGHRYGDRAIPAIRFPVKHGQGFGARLAVHFQPSGGLIRLHGRFRAAAKFPVRSIGVEAQFQKRLLQLQHIRSARSKFQRGIFGGCQRRGRGQQRQDQRKRKHAKGQRAQRSFHDPVPPWVNAVCDKARQSGPRFKYNKAFPKSKCYITVLLRKSRIFVSCFQKIEANLMHENGKLNRWDQWMGACSAHHQRRYHP